MAMLSLLAEKECTLSMVASKLNTAAANLSHHVRKLLESRLIVLVETRATARNVEKYYRASAYSYSIDLGDAKAEANRELSAFRDELVSKVARLGAKTGDGNTIFARLTSARLKASDAAAFRSRLEELSREFSAGGDDGGETYTLGLALFPDL